MTSLFGRAFRKEPAREPARLPAPQLSPEMPPRPARQPYRESRLGPDTMPKLAFGPGAVDPDWDPCGRPHPPLKNGGST